MKYNSSGNKEWTKSLVGQQFHSKGIIKILFYKMINIVIIKSKWIYFTAKTLNNISKVNYRKFHKLEEALVRFIFKRISNFSFRTYQPFYKLSFKFFFNIGVILNNAGTMIYTLQDWTSCSLEIVFFSTSSGTAPNYYTG